MKLNKHNIEFCCSLDIGMNTRDQKLKIRVDKLSVVSQFDENIEMKKTYSNLETLNHDKKRKYRVSYIPTKERNPYHNALLIRGKKKKSPVLLRIDYIPKSRNTGEIRLDFRPQHLASKK